MRLTSVLALLLALPAYASAQVPSKPLQLNFTGSTTSPDGFRAATDEYRDIWAKEGARIVAAMERATGLWFEDGPVIVYEGTSSSGQRGGRPMQLRASYPSESARRWCMSSVTGSPPTYRSRASIRTTRPTTSQH
jgi:hypothetical protein